MGNIEPPLWKKILATPVLIFLGIMYTIITFMEKSKIIKSSKPPEEKDLKN